MWQSLLKLDGNIYLFINKLPHPWWLNSFFLFFDYLTFAGIVWLLFCLGLITLGKRKGHKILGSMGLILVVMTTFIEGLLIKTMLVRRIRPFITFPNAILFSTTPTTFSFPSGQAANAFAVATFFALVFQKRILIIAFFVFSTIVAIGRVYLGAHYPLDVIVGSVIGILIGKLAFEIFRKTKWGILVLSKEKKNA